MNLDLIIKGKINTILFYSIVAIILLIYLIGLAHFLNKSHRSNVKSHAKYIRPKTFNKLLALPLVLVFLCISLYTCVLELLLLGNLIKDKNNPSIEIIETIVEDEFYSLGKTHYILANGDNYPYFTDGSNKIIEMGCKYVIRHYKYSKTIVDIKKIR